jgi:hypothetical protein
MVALSYVVTLVIVVVVVWCSAAVLLALAVGTFLRRVSRDHTPADRLPDDRRDEPRKTA